MNDMDKALYCYENTLRHNPYSVKALMQIASICRTREQYPKVPLPPPPRPSNFHCFLLWTLCAANKVIDQVVFRFMATKPKSLNS